MASLRTGDDDNVAEQLQAMRKRLAALKAVTTDVGETPTDEQRQEITSLEYFLENFGEEPLRAELQDCVWETDSGWIALKHKWVIILPYNKAMDSKRANKTFAYKRDALIRAIAEKDWRTFLFLHERPWRSDAFEELEDRFGDQISDEQYWELLQDIWTDTENLHEWENHVWRFLIGTDRSGNMMTDDEREALAKMPESFTIYRGYNQPESRGSPVTVYKGYTLPIPYMGWSWTLDRAKAEWFARRFANIRGGFAFVASARVRRDHVLAYVTERGEEEIVVEPSNVRIMQRKRLELKDKETEGQAL